MRSVMVILSLVWSVGLAAHPRPDDLYRLIDTRLEQMQAVAAHKFVRNIAIEDLEREAVVLADARRRALTVGLSPDSTEMFFAAQIEAAKVVQRYWFDVWRRGGVVPQADDLADVIRPRLIVLTASILSAVGDGVAHDETTFVDSVSVEGLPREQAQALFAALEAIEVYPDRLTQIREANLLRVATTFDYAPFSHGGVATPRGSDVALAQDLAASLGVELVWVPTTWATLVDDLMAGRYDIAMSGVSRTTARARVGRFSSAYHVGGKTPIVRCTDRQRFNGLSDIDQADVRVVVNPGGTNEAFARTRLNSAQLRVHTDNQTVFEEIIAGRADVMITDRIEVTLQSARHPGVLCAAMVDNLTYQEKGYLMPRDPELAAFVDLWLAQRLGDGTVHHLLQAAITDPS